MNILITLAVFGIPMFFLIKYLNKRAEKEKRYYTHEQLREMEHRAMCEDSNDINDPTSTAYFTVNH